MNHVSSWSRTHDTGLNPKGGPFPLLLHKLTISSVKKPRCRVAHYPLLAVTYQLNFRDRFKILWGPGQYGTSPPSKLRIQMNKTGTPENAGWASLFLCFRVFSPGKDSWEGWWKGQIHPKLQNHAVIRLALNGGDWIDRHRRDCREKQIPTLSNDSIWAV